MEETIQTDDNDAIYSKLMPKPDVGKVYDLLSHRLGYAPADLQSIARAEAASGKGGTR